MYASGTEEAWENEEKENIKGTKRMCESWFGDGLISGVLQESVLPRGHQIGKPGKKGRPKEEGNLLESIIAPSFFLRHVIGGTSFGIFAVSNGAVPVGSSDPPKTHHYFY